MKKTAYQRDLHRPVSKINRLGFADYFCGMCGAPLLRLVDASDVDIPFPRSCPACGEYVNTAKQGPVPYAHNHLYIISRDGEFITQGTLQEVARELGVRPGTVQMWATPSQRKKPHATIAERIRCE